MFIKDSESTAKFFGISETDTNNGGDILGKNINHIREKDTGIILLGQERTLYDYPLAAIYDLYKKVGSDVLMILCSSLTAARGSGERKWINTQEHISNFNVNICLRVPRDISHQIWNLQERISVAIADTLSDINPEVSIAYPFHYLLDGGKVAGHLIQKVRLDSDYDFLRIGIGTNTAPIAPKLPNNDQLARHLFSEPNSLHIPPHLWIDLAKYYKVNIQKSLQGDSRHSDFLQYLTLKKGENIEVYEDNGTTQFGSLIARGVFDSINPDGSIVMDNSILAKKEYHIKRIPNGTN